MVTKCAHAYVNGTKLYYEFTGQGHPLVLIHGYGLDTRMWDDQFYTLGQQYFVIRYDIRGFGQSDLPGKEPYTHYDDLKALLEHLHIDKAHILGLSTGGRVATEFVIMYPEYVNSLILADAGLNGYVNKEILFEEIIARAPSVGTKGANQMWLDHGLFKPACSHPDIAARMAAMVHAYSGWHWTNNNPLIPLRPPTIQQLHKIIAQTLVIIGELDLPDYQATANILAADIPGAEKIIIPASGHMSNMENPVAFNAAVLHFLGDVIYKQAIASLLPGNH